MKKKILLLAVTALVAASVTGCGDDSTVVDNITESITEMVTEEVTQETTEESAKLTTEEEKLADEATEAIMDEIKKITEEASATDGALPEYKYNGQDRLLEAVYNYTVNEIGKNFATADVGIPNPYIYGTDETETDDIKVWGNFWYFTYRLNGDTLESEAGGEFPGLMHLKQKDDGSYEVTKFEMVSDGSDFDESAKGIFEDCYDSFKESKDNTEKVEQNRKDIIREYVDDNSLSVTKYKDYGWDAIDIK